jgi:hypothetical protein
LHYDGALAVQEVIARPGENLGVTTSGWWRRQSDGSLKAVLSIGFTPAIRRRPVSCTDMARAYGVGRRRADDSPVGPAIAFDPSQPPGAPPTLMPQRQDDNILIASSAAAFHDFGSQVAIEALVWLKGDASGADGGRQFVLGKSRNAMGFSLFFEPDAGEAPNPGNFVWRVGDGSQYYDLMNTSVEAVGEAWYYLVGTFNSVTDVQALWVNGEKVEVTVTATPQWGINDLRLGAPSAADESFLDGDLGGYVALLATVPADAYVKASHQNLVAQSFVAYGTPEPRP